MKRFYYICLTAIVLLAMNNKNTYSQFVTATNNDLVAVSSICDVENTGNDVRLFKNSTDYNMYIMTWDGDAPGFAWDDEESGYSGRYDIEGTNYGTVTDPDIVLYDCNVMRTQIVYILDDNVYYEFWRYNPLNYPYTWVLTTGPTAITQNGNCSCPNIDVDEEGNTVIVWEENGEIYAVAGDVDGNYSQEVHISDGHTPDVALNYKITNSTTDANIVFIMDDANDTHLSIVETDYTTIDNNGNIPMPTNLYMAVYADNEYFGRPRIAGPPPNIYTSPLYEIVVKFYANGRHYIQSHNPSNPNSPEIINNNLPADISGDINKDPAVSYCGGHIIVTWTYDDSNLGYTSNTVDVISRLLYSNGTTSIYTPCNVYSVVNKNTSGVQGVSSVAGRFSSSSSSEQKLVTFFNEDNSEVNYKIRPFASTQFRLKPPEIQTDVYPNPTSDFINIKIETEFETAKLELYNLQGQIIIQKAITEQKFQLDVSKLNSGIYKLRISTGSSNEIKSIEII